MELNRKDSNKKAALDSGAAFFFPMGFLFGFYQFYNKVRPF